MQIATITRQDNEYPDSLRQIHYPPERLYILGQFTKAPHVAIVGSRQPTEYGLGVTYRLAFDLARAGVVIVSGLALGIDAAAHQAALEAGGLTVAVQANGLDNLHPPTNQTLGRKILESRGVIISEYPVGTSPFKQNFVARNRIVAGLCQAVIVPEANAQSGALITANYALEANRQVMAVPGNITSERSAGPNNLIRSGATAVTSAADVLASLDLTSTALRPEPVRADGPEEALILELLTKGHASSQKLIESSGLSASQFAEIISLMEITGKVRNLGAGQWISK